MHEMSYVVRLCNTALEAARRERLTKVTAIHANIGQMVGIEPFYMHKYYKTAAKNTLLDGSELTINIIPVTARCNTCNNEYTPDAAHDYLCPACKSGDCRIIKGREFLLIKIEGEYEE